MFTDSSTDFVFLALQSAGVGTWEIDLVHQRVRWDNCCQGLYGLSGHDEIAYEKLWFCVHPEDRPLVEQTLEWSLDTRSGGHYDIRFRTIGADTGQLRWVRCQGRAYFRPDGKAYRVVGIAQDVTKDQPTRRELADPTRLEKLSAAISGVGVYRLSLVTDELIHSPGFAYILTGNVSAIMSRTDFFAALHPQDELLRQTALEDAARMGVLHYEPRFVWPDGTIHHTRILGAMHRDELGKPAFLIGHITEITQSTIRPPDTEIRFQTLIGASPVAMGLFQGTDLVVETANEAMHRLLDGGPEIIGKPLLTVLAHWQDQPFATSLQQAYTTGDSIILPQQVVSSWQEGQLINRHYTYHYAPILDNGRNVYAILVTALDISEQVGAKKRAEISEARFQSIIEQAPLAICILKGRSMIMEAANAKVFDMWDADESIMGLPIKETGDDVLKQGFQKILEEVFDTGKPFFGHDMRVELKRKNKLEITYFDLVYTPLYDTSGAVTGIMTMATEVTGRVLARKAIEENKDKLSIVLNAAPTAMGLYVGRNLIIEVANQAFIDIVGKGPDVIGKSLWTLMPELERQPYIQIIDSVFTSGKPFEHFGLPVDILRQGVMTHNYYNISYSPLRDATGQVYAVLGTGIDVTEEIEKRLALEESEQHYRLLSEELARQMTLKK